MNIKMYWLCWVYK